MHHKKDILSSIESTILPPDTNNNCKKIEKYSLRQRYKRQCSRSKQTTKPSSLSTDNNTLSNETPNSSLITLNPQNRCKSTKTTPTKQKPKSKAAPLSKYRRKTANARERTRMREINSAFENLRKCVPLSISNGTPTPTNNEKLTKITTLRLAMKYIRTLSAVLKSPIGEHSFMLNDETNNNNDSNFILSNSSSSSSYSNCSNSSNSSSGSHYNSIANSNSNSNEIFSDLFLSANPESISSNNHNTRTNATDVKQRLNSLMCKKSSSSSTIQCLSPSIDTDLGLILESDGESLHLSEPCLSPLSNNMKAFSCSTSSALELGILMESDTDSLQLSDRCLSPLGGLDSLNPFGDLLHTGFSEQANLDLYLT